MALARCDGCDAAYPIANLHLDVEFGVQVRYCEDCSTIWAGFESAHNAMAARFQALLEQWTEQQRASLPLKVTPFDFPAMAARSNGALRLG